MEQIPIKSIPFDQIKVEESGFTNVRTDMDQEALGELLEDIAKNGLHTVLTVWETDEGDFILCDGHRRHTAIDILRKQCEEAGADIPFDTVQCGVFTGDVNRALAKNLELALQHNPPHPADVMRRAHELYKIYGRQAVVAEMVGRSQAWVSIQTRVYANLIPEGFMAARSNFITMAQAHTLSEVLDDDGNPDVEAQKELLEFMITGKKPANDEPQEEKPKTKRSKKEIVELYELALKAKESPDIDVRVPTTIIKVLEWNACKLELPDVFSEEDVARDLSIILGQ